MRGAVPTGAGETSISTSTGIPISTTPASTGRIISRILRHGANEKAVHFNMTRVIAKASATETMRRRRSSTRERVPSKFRLEKTFAAALTAAGKNWRAKAAPATEEDWELRVGSEIAVGWPAKAAAQGIEELWQIEVEAA